MKKLIYPMLIIAALSGAVQAQTGNVGIGTTTPHPDASLELGSASKGFLPNRVPLSATNIAAPLAAHIEGMVVYNTDTAGIPPNNVTPGLYYNDGTKWVKLAPAAMTLINVTTSRSFGVDYTNTLPYSITVMFRTGNASADQNALCYVNNVYVAVEQSWPGIPGSATFVVPPGGTYRIENNVGTMVAPAWMELR